MMMNHNQFAKQLKPGLEILFSPGGLEKLKKMREEQDRLWWDGVDIYSRPEGNNWDGVLWRGQDAIYVFEVEDKSHPTTGPGQMFQGAIEYYGQGTWKVYRKREEDKKS